VVQLGDVDGKIEVGGDSKTQVHVGIRHFDLAAAALPGLASAGHAELPLWFGLAHAHDLCFGIIDLEPPLMGIFGDHVHHGLELTGGASKHDQVVGVRRT
jgi:hypothetical protein